MCVCVCVCVCVCHFTRKPTHFFFRIPEKRPYFCVRPSHSLPLLAVAIPAFCGSCEPSPASWGGLGADLEIRASSLLGFNLGEDCESRNSLHTNPRDTTQTPIERSRQTILDRMCAWPERWAIIACQALRRKARRIHSPHTTHKPSAKPCQIPQSRAVCTVPRAHRQPSYTILFQRLGDEVQKTKNSTDS